jgi:hypothetical protein
MKSCYEPIKYGMRGDRAAVRASVILLSGCQDNQLSGDGAGNGLFTSKLLEVWNRGSFSGSYGDFISAIKKRMPFSQTPNLYRTGASSSVFESQKPFSTESPRYFPTGSQDDSQALDFVLHISREFVESASDKELLKFLRTDGADVLAASYMHWKEVKDRMASVVSNREVHWEIKGETDSKGGAKVSGSIGGSF